MKKRLKKIFSLKSVTPYKEPVFLFTSSSMRIAAYAGWYSALGDEKNAEAFVRQAYTEWAKEVGMGRKYGFVRPFNLDLYNKADFEVLKRLTDKYLSDINKILKAAKKS